MNFIEKPSDFQNQVLLFLTEIVGVSFSDKQRRISHEVRGVVSRRDAAAFGREVQQDILEISSNCVDVHFTSTLSDFSMIGSGPVNRKML
jgi:hypothetical protein